MIAIPRLRRFAAPLGMTPIRLFCSSSAQSQFPPAAARPSAPKPEDTGT